MGCSSMHSISTLLKRISSIERMIDIDDCLTMFKLCQFASMDIPFFSRPYLFGVLITFFRPLFVCFLYIHPTVASGRFSQLLERGRDHIRPTQEERWRHSSSRLLSKMAPIILPSSVFSSSSSSTGYVSRRSMGLKKQRNLRKSISTLFLIIILGDGHCFVLRSVFVLSRSVSRSVLLFRIVFIVLVSYCLNCGVMY